MKVKRMTAALLMAAMTCGVLTGCSQDSKEGEQKTVSGGSGAEQTADYGVEEVVMVLIPGEDTEKSVQLRDDMAEEMSKAIGIPVTTYRATDYSAAVEAMRTGHAQLAMLGPFSYVTARERAGAECLVTTATNGEIGYYSHIITSADSDIDSVEDLEGKTFAFVDPESTSGNVVPSDEILNEIGDDDLSFDDLHTDGKFFKSAMYAGNHAASLQAVVQGNVDAAAVSSNTYQNQLDEGNFNEEDVKIIHTSPLIPASPIAVQKDLPQELKDKIRDFLLDYSEEYFTALGEPDKRYVEVEDSTYDYLAELKEEYGLSD